ncbi:hypothetical protein PR202_ga08077 [Eleusine coracana subsp. coracana]|uniref:F-box domain-containing protein n=1 Tax=Eleusine coracana subsp. coracana TaxID=191504 RepID=A0AAV5C1M6_ELECO|nr:hypothetical protein PR202_ga08077 [Eleusine coracana subsp. coracana]
MSSPADDLILEVFLRLPPHPTCLLHVSLVCKHWRRLIHGHWFLNHLRARHHNVAPLLGFFHKDGFVPTGDSPDRLSAAHFSQLQGSGWMVLSSRHGRVLLRNTYSMQSEALLLVWDPMTGGRSYLPIHPKYRRNGCSSRPFSVVFLFAFRGRVFAGVYSSQTKEWGDLVSMGIPRELSSIKEANSVFISNALYLLWPCNYKIKIIRFHLATKRLQYIEISQSIHVVQAMTKMFQVIVLGGELMSTLQDGSGMLHK